MGPTHVLLVYDIEEDRRRTKIADACLDYGLDRIQFSAFAGVLSRTHREELMLKISHLLDETPGKIHLYVIDDNAWTHRLIIETDSDAEVYDRQPVSAD
ncbi:MAG: CRISPR-associated endonuclease Cas2 [Chloroflexota bacterium]